MSRQEIIQDNFFEELQRVFDHFPKYNMKILLVDFNAKVGRANIFKPAVGNWVCLRVVMMMV